MNKVCIFGSGQAGAMALTWLPAGNQVLSFIDNKKEKQGLFLLHKPVESLGDALKREPDEILIAVLNKEAAEEIKKQIASSGFTGEVSDVNELRRRIDIRLSAIRLSAGEIEEKGIEGDIAELGVYRGETASELNRLFPERKLYLFDTFTGFDERDLKKEKELTGRKSFYKSFSDTDTETVERILPHPEKAVFIKGYFPDSLKEKKALIPDDLSFSLVSLDTDLYAPTYEGLKYFCPRLSSGGRIFIHDYTSLQFDGVKKAVDKYCAEKKLFVLPLMDMHGSAVLIRQ